MNDLENVTDELLYLVSDAIDNGLLAGEVGFRVADGALYAETYGEDAEPARRWRVNLTIEEIAV